MRNPLNSGAEGGQLKFCGKTKPAGAAQELSRWSYSDQGPDASSAQERVEGDIHFSPSNYRGTNEPFLYWVCTSGTKGKGNRWLRYNCGQPHPRYAGFVLRPQSGNLAPRWLREPSFKARNS